MQSSKAHLKQLNGDCYCSFNMNAIK